MAKLLIVDDNKQNLALMRDFTESWGYTVLTSLHGTEAIEITKKQMPDAILLDVMLPGMSGYEVCKELKENEQTADIPIVMVTALMDMEDRIHGLKLGADYFLSKPLPYNELRVVLENLVSKKIQIESGESCFAVMETLTKLIGPCLSLNKMPLKNDMMFYSKKIVKLLHLDKKAEDQTAVATMLYNTGIFADEAKMKMFLASIEGLKLNVWLRPLVEGTLNFENCLNSEDIVNTKAAVNIMALLIDYFSTLETIKSEDRVLELLQNKKIYEEKTLKALNKIVNDKKMFDFLNNEF
ncbi:MAG: response regulator [Acidaminococcaceae bacterium]